MLGVSQQMLMNGKIKTRLFFYLKQNPALHATSQADAILESRQAETRLSNHEQEET
jgi:hypothetical protein